MSSHSRLSMSTCHCPKTAPISSQSRNEMIISRLLGEQSITTAGLWFYYIVNRAQNKVPRQRKGMKNTENQLDRHLDSGPMDGLRGLAVPAEATGMLNDSPRVLLPEQSGSTSVASFMLSDKHCGRPSRKKRINMKKKEPSLANIHALSSSSHYMTWLYFPNFSVMESCLKVKPKFFVLLSCTWVVVACWEEVELWLS